MASVGDLVEAVLTKDEKIIEMATYEKLKIEADKEIDLQRAIRYPGFFDSHRIGHGEKLLSLDLSATVQMTVVEGKVVYQV